MKVFLKGYTKINLGDDLFYKVILDRYSSNIKFYTSYHNPIFSLKKYKNLKMINDKILSKLERSYNIKNFYIRHVEKKCDLTIRIGGSLFMESQKSTNKIQKNKVFHDEYIIGANFGPYYSQKFLDYYRTDYFPKMKDVYFRESYSYNLFKSLKNVRYGNDVIFMLNTDNIKITNKKRVIFSVINAYNKVEKELADKYFDEIIKLINIFLKKHYEILLMSFCKFEGDEEAISIIEKKANRKFPKYYYRGNIEEALNKMADSQIIVGTRFHANILGFLMNKIVIPIAYSDKTLNVLSDLDFKGKVFDIRNKEKMNFNYINYYLNNNKLDISKIKKDVNNPFNILDKVLERK